MNFDCPSEQVRLSKGVPDSVVSVLVFKNSGDKDKFINRHSRILQENYKRDSDTYQKLAEKGDAGRQVRLGTMYADGRGIAKDETKAVHWFLKAVEQGNAEAQKALNTLKKRASERGIVKKGAQGVSLDAKSRRTGKD